jgi:hypothetical protein
MPMGSMEEPPTAAVDISPDKSFGIRKIVVQEGEKGDPIPRYSRCLGAKIYIP